MDCGKDTARKDCVRKDGMDVAAGVSQVTSSLVEPQSFEAFLHYKSATLFFTFITDKTVEGLQAALFNQIMCDA